MRRLGVVGLGMIGQAVVKASDRGEIPFVISGVYHRKPETSVAFRKSLKSPPPLQNLIELAAGSDLIFEAASRPAVEEICNVAFPQRKDIVIASVGALLERPHLLKLAEQHGVKIYAPSGGMIGLDGLKGAAVGEIKSVVITTRKSPQSLKNTPHVKSNNLDMDAVREPLVIFEGSPADALKGFPSNINVSASVSLAGIGPQRTTLRIIADPAAIRNIHEVEVTGEFGRSLVRVENVPAGGTGPGMLSYLSCIAFFKQFGQTLVIGT